MPKAVVYGLPHSESEVYYESPEKNQVLFKLQKFNLK